MKLADVCLVCRRVHIIELRSWHHVCDSSCKQGRQRWVRLRTALRLHSQRTQTHQYPRVLSGMCKVLTNDSVFMVATTMMRVLSVHVVMLTLLLIVLPFASTTDAVMALRPRLHTSPNCIRCVLLPLRVVYRFMTYQATTAASFMRCFTRSTHKPTVARTTTMQPAYALLWWQL